jgi:hypothetical protein
VRDYKSPKENTDTLTKLSTQKRQKRAIFLKKAAFFILCLAIFGLFTSFRPRWGFWAHKRINRLAVFRLPPEMQVFYKKHIDFLTDHAVNPDQRRYAVPGEAERHYIDLDVYGDSALNILPKYWAEAVRKMGEDSLRKHGIVPWQLQLTAYQLTQALKDKKTSRILRLSADLGHYVADAHVPLHTTRNYNGQLTGQEGIHGFWESRLPELFADQFDMWIGNVNYIDNISQLVWETVAASHAASDSVFIFEKQLTEQFDADKKFTYELRNNILTRTYSRSFAEKYHVMLSGQVERRMKASVKLVGDLWYTCWVNAGQPELSGLDLSESEANEEAAEPKSWFRRLFNVRTEAE